MWDWLKMLASWDYHQLAFDKWPGWELDPNTKEPYFIRLSFTKGGPLSSRNMAIEWDDAAEGNFYYRDFTESGLPILDESEPYRSTFVFQLERDYIGFKNHFNYHQGTK